MAEVGGSLFALVYVLGAGALAFQHFRYRGGTGPALVYVSLLLVCSSALVDGAVESSGPSAAAGALFFSLALWSHFKDEEGETSELYSGPKSRWQLILAISFVALLWLGLPIQISLPVGLIWLIFVIDRSNRWHWALLIAGAVLAAGMIGLKIFLGSISWDFFTPLTYGFTPGLLGSNFLYLIAGRNVGILVWYLPFFFLLLCYRPGHQRGWMLFAIGVAVILRLALEPHNFFGGPVAVGSGTFLPLYVGAWYLPKRVPGPLVLSSMVLASGLFLWPAWISPVATWLGEDRPAQHEYSLASYLPYETTQEFVPYSTEWEGTGVLSRSLGPGLEDSDRGPVLVPDNGPAELMIAAERPLEAVLLDFGPEAKSEIKVEGGEVGNVVFKPDGGVRFEVTFGEPDREHRMWWSEKTHYIYLFDFEMPGAAGASLPVAILARPKEALPRSLDSSSAALPWPAEVEGVELSDLPEPSVLFEPAEPEGVS